MAESLPKSCLDDPRLELHRAVYKNDLKAVEKLLEEYVMELYSH